MTAIDVSCDSSDLREPMFRADGVRRYLVGVLTTGARPEVGHLVDVLDLGRGVSRAVPCSVVTGSDLDREIGLTGVFGLSVLTVVQSHRLVPGSRTLVADRFMPAGRFVTGLVEGACATFACRVTTSHHSGAHAVHVGEVVTTTGHAMSPLCAPPRS